jgi:phospholipase C
MIRAFLFLMIAAGIVACAGAGTGTGANAPSGLPALQSSMPESGRKKPIEHVVIVIQENRSFDNLFATFPGADGTTTGRAAAMAQSEAQYCAANGMPAITKPTSIPLTETNLFGAGFGSSKTFDEDTDLDHIHIGFELERDHNKMDGFDLSDSEADGSGLPTCTYTYQYVNPQDIAPYWDIAKEYVLADHTFQTQGSGSFTAHQDLIAGGTQISSNEALIDNPSYFPWGCDANAKVVTAIIKRSGKVYEYGGPFPCLSYSTLRDLLEAKRVSWKFYAVKVQKWTGPAHGNTPGIWSAFDAIKAVRYSPEWFNKVTRSPTVIFNDIKSGTLPAVSWVAPDGPNSDHPAVYVNEEPVDDGPSWVASIVNAIGQSKYWSSTAIVIVWDDWGGFYDHVPPPMPFDWQGGPGFRVPMLIVSPYVRPHVDHTLYQFGSILRFIEDVFDLGSLGKSDAHANSIGDAFNFRMSPRKFQAIPSKYSSSYFLSRPPSGIAPDTE